MMALNKDKERLNDGYINNEGNPFLDSLPPMKSKEEFTALMTGSPYLPADISSVSPEERRLLLTKLDAWYEPLDYMYILYDMLYRAIMTTYRTKTIADSVRQIDLLYRNMREGKEDEIPYATSGYSGAVLGCPGIGKTSAIKRCLSMIPQVIVHTEYQGRPFYTKQINHLMVECPSDCSVKTLAYNIISAIDRAIGSDYLSEACVKATASALSTKLKIICLNHHVGLIVIDEIQNAVLTAQKNKQTRPLIKFLVELTNETATSVVFCGTLEAEELFTREEHLKRRTRGLRLLPFKYDSVYRKFILRLWENQVVLKKTVLTEKLMKQIYDLSGGIPAYIIKLFEEAQVQAILSGREELSYEMFTTAAAVLGIEVPKTYGGKGTSISEFGITVSALSEGEKEKDKETEKITALPETAEPEEPRDDRPVKRFYATKRGRPVKEREKEDILSVWEKTGDAAYLINTLDGYGMIERRCY